MTRADEWIITEITEGEWIGAYGTVMFAGSFFTEIAEKILGEWFGPQVVPEPVIVYSTKITHNFVEPGFLNKFEKPETQPMKITTTANEHNYITVGELASSTYFCSFECNDGVLTEYYMM